MELTRKNGPRWRVEMKWHFCPAFWEKIAHDKRVISQTSPRVPVDSNQIIDLCANIILIDKIIVYDKRMG